jgi:hypothetical protein
METVDHVWLPGTSISGMFQKQWGAARGDGMVHNNVGNAQYIFSVERCSSRQVYRE